MKVDLHHLRALWELRGQIATRRMSHATQGIAGAMTQFHALSAESTQVAGRLAVPLDKPATRARLEDLQQRLKHEAARRLNYARQLHGEREDHRVARARCERRIEMWDDLLRRMAARDDARREAVSENGIVE